MTKRAKFGKWTCPNCGCGMTDPTCLVCGYVNKKPVLLKEGSKTYHHPPKTAKGKFVLPTYKSLKELNAATK